MIYIFLLVNHLLLMLVSIKLQIMSTARHKQFTEIPQNRATKIICDTTK